MTVLLLTVQIMEHYGVSDFHTPLEFLAMLARRQGKLKKGGLPDADKAAKSVLLACLSDKLPKTNNITIFVFQFTNVYNRYSRARYSYRLLLY